MQLPLHVHSWAKPVFRMNKAEAVSRVAHVLTSIRSTVEMCGSELCWISQGRICLQIRDIQQSVGWLARDGGETKSPDIINPLLKCVSAQSTVLLILVSNLLIYLSTHLLTCLPCLCIKTFIHLFHLCFICVGTRFNFLCSTVSPVLAGLFGR